MQNNTSSALPFSTQVRLFIRRSPARMAVIIALILFAFTVVYMVRVVNPNIELTQILSAVSSIIMLTLLLSFASAGQTIVLIGGGMDFTVGAVMSMAAILTTQIMDAQDGRFFPAFVAVMVMALAVGLLNGLCTVKIGLPPLIVTLAIANVVTQLQYVFTQGSPMGYAAPAFIRTVTSRLSDLFPTLQQSASNFARIFSDYVLSTIPTLAFYAMIIIPLVFYILNRSRFGRQLYLVGNNAIAARLTGISVNKVKIMSYVVSAMFSGFAGMLGAAYMQSARCQMFDDYAYNSLIAVIVGGTAFSGGVGSYTGSISGALLMVVLSNMLSVLNLDRPTRNIVMGVIMVLLLVMYNRKKPVRQ